LVIISILIKEKKEEGNLPSKCPQYWS